jgi:hypothetical protein
MRAENAALPEMCNVLENHTIISTNKDSNGLVKASESL